jgi:hypothetical protein
MMKEKAKSEQIPLTQWDVMAEVKNLEKST